jgi:hypothetical protein
LGTNKQRLSRASSSNLNMRRQWRQCFKLSQLLTSVYHGSSTIEFVCQHLSHLMPMFPLTITIAQIMQSPESGISVTSSSSSILVFTQVIPLMISAISAQASGIQSNILQLEVTGTYLNNSTLMSTKSLPLLSPQGAQPSSS